MLEAAATSRRSRSSTRSTERSATDSSRRWREVERLLTAAQVESRSSTRLTRRAQYCLREYFAELDRGSRAGFDPDREQLARREELRPPPELLLVATLSGNRSAAAR